MSFLSKKRSNVLLRRTQQAYSNSRDVFNDNPYWNSNVSSDYSECISGYVFYCGTTFDSRNYAIGNDDLADFESFRLSAFRKEIFDHAPSFSRFHWRRNCSF